jgi:hypothetical protein
VVEGLHGFDSAVLEGRRGAERRNARHTVGSDEAIEVFGGSRNSVRDKAYVP